MLATVTITRRPHMIENVIDNISHQVRKPDLAVIVTHGFESSHLQFLSSCPYVTVMADKSLVHGELMNIAMNLAASKLGSGMLCTWDDDDYYGPLYLSGVEHVRVRRPDAILIGKCEYVAENTDEHGYKTIKTLKAGATKPIETGISYARSFAGPTICINAEIWNGWPDIRYQSLTLGAELRLIQDLYGCWEKEADCVGELEWAPFYSSGTDNFVLKRYWGQEHNHGWRGFV